MTPEMIALARRAVACKGWRWMPGMRVEWVGMGTGWRMLSETQSWYEREECADGEPGGPNSVPDLTDAATLGCLLALVRVAMDDLHAGVCWSLGDEVWVCEGQHEYEGKTYLGTFVQAPTYAEALVAALEAAP